MATTVSIEYAHIYTNQYINDEHELSVELLGDAISQFTKNGKTTSLVVMVDDYSFPDPAFDYGTFTDWLEGKGYKPAILFRESQLIPLCDDVIAMVTDQKLRTHLTDYIKSKKYPCSLFIAAWYLVRLGVLSSPLFPSDLVADELLNILPESFKPFEDKGLEIIRSTPHASRADSIAYKFIPGRLIA